MANLVQRRAGHRGYVTKLIAKIKAIIDDATLDREFKIHDLGKKIGDLHSRLKTIQEIDTDIQDNVPMNDLPDEMDNAYTFYSGAKDSLDHAEYSLTKLEQEERQNNAPPPPLPLPVPQNPGGINQLPIPQFSHLPKFELPEFKSDILLWRSFWDVFETEVHHKTQYPDAKKIPLPEFATARRG